MSSSPSAAGLQCPHLLLHQHRGCLHPLPGRGLPETGVPGDPGVYPGTAPLTAGEPAAGKCGTSGPCRAAGSRHKTCLPSSCAPSCCPAPPLWVGAQPWGMFPLEGAQHSWLCGNAPGETLKSSTPALARCLPSVPLWFCQRARAAQALRQGGALHLSPGADGLDSENVSIPAGD